MALVLPTLRLWLLLLNVYGTFKSMKPPPQSQRGVRNGKGPSARAMQLRKRELKSRLAVWVVWAMISTIERPLDSTIGLFTPFYNELKCIVFLFLLVARAHAAEAIFLHIIHPLVRPYVPAVDDILANLHSVFDLFVLLLFLPLEYVSDWWSRWRWFGKAEAAEEEDEPSNSDGDGGGVGGEVLLEGRRRLRPRNNFQQSTLRQADTEAQAVFKDIDEAQDRVRMRTRSQPVAFASRNNGRNQAIPGPSGAELHPNSVTVGLRTRKRMLEYPVAPNEGQARGPGSRTTGVHHIPYSSTINALPQVPSSQPFPAFPNAPATQPAMLPVQPNAPLRVPVSQDAPATDPSHHEIRYPPPSSYEGRPPASTDDSTRTPSPIYPPLPSAYPFTPRRSEPLPPPLRIIAPPNLVTPTPRRVSAGVNIEASGSINRYSGRSEQAGPSRSARSAEPSLPQQRRYKQDRIQAEDFFGQALEPSIQVAEMDMDTRTPSTKDDSSANGEDIEMDGDEPEVGVEPARRAVSRTRKGLRSRRAPDSEIKKGKRKATNSGRPLRRSTRTRSASVETDEFGFTIRPGSSTLESTTTDSTSSSSGTTQASVTVPSKKKPLARTKPIPKPVQGGDETESSDEESVKKRRKLRPETEDLASELQEVEGGDLQQEEESQNMASRPGHNSVAMIKGKRKKGAQRAAGQTSKVKQNGLHPTWTTRASSTREPVSSKESQPQAAGIIKRGKGR